MGETVLVLGSGGREHALAWKLRASPRVKRALVAPGNPGMEDVADRAQADTAEQWLALAREQQADLVVIGPEAPLVDGMADQLRNAGFLVFGPGRDAARLEGDKSYAKDFLNAAGVPTPRAEPFDDLERALAYLHAQPGPCVVKATGLAAGKGVSVCDDLRAAEKAVRECIADGAFGQAGRQILIEERLYGRELSVFAVFDGERMAWFAPSRDHKRLADADRGPNTGGMGAYTPVRDATPSLMQRIEQQILGPTLAELQRRGLEYRGLLYVGLILDERGPSVLEFNCRFGDPETQVVLPSYDGDLYELLRGAASGRLPVAGPLASSGAAVGVVLASAGYPTGSEKGVPIPGLSKIGAQDLVFHAATRLRHRRWESDGGRVLCAVGRAPQLRQARCRAEELADRLHFRGAQRRHDIAAQEEQA